MTLGRNQSRIEADLPADRAHSLLPNCLDRCSFVPPEPLRIKRSERRMKDQRTALGKGTASSALAPSKRTGFAALGSNIREWYRPQARKVDQLTWGGLVKFRPHCNFSLSTIQIAQQCGPFATYRRVSCPFTSTIADS